MSKKDSNSNDGRSPLLMALMSHTVTAETSDLDHFRIRGGMAVETDYIISVQPVTKQHQKQQKTPSMSATVQGDFDPFTLSKTYSSFRSLAHQLKKAADRVTSSSVSGNKALPPAVVKVAKYCELVTHLVESQRTQYLGKVNYMYVKVLSKQRMQIIHDVLETTCAYFPAEIDSHPLLAEVASMVETFFLTDHCDADVSERGAHHHHSRSLSGVGSALAKEASNLNPFKTKSSSNSSSDDEKTHEHNKHNPLSWIAGLGTDQKKSDDAKSKRKHLASIVVPITRRSRRNKETRDLDEEELSKVGDVPRLLLDDDRPQTELVPSYSKPIPTVRSGGSKIGMLIENNPLAFLAIAAGAVYVLRLASESKITMDGDIALLTVFACFCLGLHTPRPMVGGFDRPPTMKGSFIHDPSGRRLLRRSMVASTPRNGSVALSASGDDILQPDLVMGSPMALFPEGADIGSHNNCYSVPNAQNFKVRGPNYLVDKKKIPSQEFMFPVRGIDLFLTDTCPENVGANSSVYGGSLRSMPTFIINFRLPWAVLVFYSEIPERFIPFLKAGYEADFDKSKLPDLKSMSASDRTVCRFLVASKEEKNSTIKIVPFVVDGPWVTKQVVGGKPALIGKKVPVNYVYQPAEDGKASYLEADLDIAASSAARGILSVARTYTQVLTLDLGFVIQGNETDELPEQMLVGARLHGVDPLTAPQFPPTANMFSDTVSNEDNESVTPVE